MFHHCADGTAHFRACPPSLGQSGDHLGGLPSTLLSPSVPEGEFRDYVNHLWEIIAPGEAFILGVADNVMPDSLIERIRWVSEQINEKGWYPIPRSKIK